MVGDAPDTVRGMVSWPWKRRVEVVLVEDAGDDATATLAMILRYHRRTIAIADVAEALSVDSGPVRTALDIVHAAEHFRLQTRAVELAHASHFGQIPLPCIAHMSRTLGSLPRRHEEYGDCYFALIERVTPSTVHWIDPYEGRVEHFQDDLAAQATGVCLLFGEADPLPGAMLRSARGSRV